MKKYYHQNNRKTWFVFFLTLVTAILSLNFLPDQLPIHFNSQGVPDNFAGKWSIFLAPAVILIILFLAEILRDIDPKSKNYKKFEEYYYGIHFAVSLLMFFIQFYIITYVSGFKIEINKLIYPLIALLFIFIGNILPKFKHNYFVGIRTSWTIASEKVWYLTHRFSGKLFVSTGIVLLFLSLFVRKYLQIFLILIIAFLVLLPILFSYYSYQKHEENN